MKVLKNIICILKKTCIIKETKKIFLIPTIVLIFSKRKPKKGDLVVMGQKKIHFLNIVILFLKRAIIFKKIRIK